MNREPEEAKDLDQLSREDKNSVLFANLVLQQTNMALMFLGKIQQSEDGPPMFDLASAEMIIDQLEMLQQKTKGNLSARESQLLQQSLTNLRMAFVEAVETDRAGSAASPPAPETSSMPEQKAKVVAEPNAPVTDKEEAGRVKYSKKY